MAGPRREKRLGELSGYAICVPSVFNLPAQHASGCDGMECNHACPLILLKSYCRRPKRLINKVSVHTKARIISVTLGSSCRLLCGMMNTLALAPDGVRKLIAMVMASRRLSLSTAALLVASSYLAYSTFKRRYYAAPGPPRLPLLGNLLQIPSQLHFLKYTEWAQIYGTICCAIVQYISRLTSTRPGILVGCTR